MTGEEPVIVASSVQEREVLRASFPNACIAVPGNQLSGKYSCALVSPSVDLQDPWFGSRVVTALPSPGMIFQITERAKVPADG